MAKCLPLFSETIAYKVQTLIFRNKHSKKKFQCDKLQIKLLWVEWVLSLSLRNRRVEGRMPEVVLSWKHLELFSFIPINFAFELCSGVKLGNGDWRLAKASLVLLSRLTRIENFFILFTSHRFVRAFLHPTWEEGYL